jgi:hypothetical protein
LGNVVPHTLITHMVFLAIPLRTIDHSHIEDTLIGIKVSKGRGRLRASVAVVGRRVGHLLLYYDISPTL